MEIDDPNQYCLIKPNNDNQKEKAYLKRYSEIHFINDDQKQEALLKYWKDKKEKLKIIGKGNDEVNVLLDKFYTWKDSFYQPIRYGSVPGSIFSLLCISLGSNILSLPYTVKNVGVIPSMIIYIISAILSYTTLRILVNLADRTCKMDYIELVKLYLGKNWVIATFYINLLSNFGSIIVYLKFISNFILSTLNYIGINEGSGYNSENLAFYQMFICMILFEIPLCIVENIRPLHLFSIFGTGLLFYVVLTSFLEKPYFFYNNLTSDNVSWIDFNISAFQAFCIYFFTFENHNPILNIVSELKTPTEKKLIKIVNITSIIEFSFCLIVMYLGYFSTLDKTSDIYIDRAYQSIYLMLGKLLYVIPLLCNVGLYYFISKPYLEVLFNSSNKFSVIKNFYVASSLMITLNIIAYSYDSIAGIISIIGATSAIYLMFIIPILLYLKDREDKLSLREKLLCYVILSCIMLIGLAYICIFLIGF